MVGGGGGLAVVKESLGMFVGLGRWLGNEVGGGGMCNGGVRRDFAGGDVSRDRMICLTWFQYDRSVNCW